MRIIYRTDPDLEFLKYCNNDDLAILVDYLITDNNGSLRITQELTTEPQFIDCGGKYNQVWFLIASELQLYGANSFISFFRNGEGVLYQEILSDVCKRLKVTSQSTQDVLELEKALFLKIAGDSLKKMTDDEKRELADSLNINMSRLTVVGLRAALQAGIRMGGISAYQLALIIANNTAKILLGRGLSQAATVGLTRSLAIFSGPIGWLITGLLSIPMISGPAYRVTIPSVIQVAFMRLKYLEQTVE
ncbi:MAG: DUF3944 domain-containing protein [Methylococcales bacterium]|nr:DUF3944 domain-containing protein [Methylococcales bacterium]